MTRNPAYEQRAATMPFDALAGRAVLDPASGNATADWGSGLTAAISTAKRPTRHLGRTST
jgi:hypothetical protein